MEVKIKTELVNKNIKFLQEFIGYNDDDVANLLCISKRQYQRFKRSDVDSVGFREVVSFFSELYGITEDEILTTDLTKGFDDVKTKKMLEKFTISEFEECKDLQQKILSVYPSFETSVKSKNFDNAYICLKHFLKTGEINVDFLTLAQGFEFVYKDENIPEALANALVCYLIYFSLASCPTDAKEDMTLAEVIEKYGSTYNEKLNKLNEMYSSQIDNGIKQLSEHAEFKEFIDYYIALRYLKGAYPPDQVEMDLPTMQRFGRSLMSNLQKAGNKYCK